MPGGLGISFRRSALVRVRRSSDMLEDVAPFRSHVRQYLARRRFGIPPSVVKQRSSIRGVERDPRMRAIPQRVIFARSAFRHGPVFTVCEKTIMLLFCLDRVHSIYPPAIGPRCPSDQSRSPPIRRWFGNTTLVTRVCGLNFTRWVAAAPPKVDTPPATYDHHGEKKNSCCHLLRQRLSEAPQNEIVQRLSSVSGTPSDGKISLTGP